MPNASERTSALEELFAVIRVEIEDLSCTSVPGALTALAEGQAITAAALRKGRQCAYFPYFPRLYSRTLGSGKGSICRARQCFALVKCDE